MQNYTVTVEVDDNKAISSDDVDRVMEELADFAPALSNSPRGWRTATIAVPGSSMRQAIASAAAVVEAAYGAEAIVVEAMTETEADIRQGWVQTPDLVSVSQAAELLGVSRQRVLQRISEKTLPATQVGSGWVIPRSAVESEGETSSSRVPS